MLSYRRETARHAASFETLPIVTQLYERYACNCEGHPRSSEMAPISFLLVLCRNNVSILHHFRDITTFAVKVTDREGLQFRSLSSLLLLPAGL